MQLPRFLLGRLYLLAALLAADCALLASIPHAAPLLGPLAPAGIVAFAVFLGLGHRKLKAQREDIEFRPDLFFAHLLCVGAVSLADFAAQHGSAWWVNDRPMQLAFGATVAVGIVLLALACMPMKAWISMAAETSPAGQYAVLAGIAAWFLRSPFQSLWIHSSAANVYVLQVIAFRSVQAILGFLLPDLVVDAGPFLIGTPRFTVSVGAPCSGIEGLGLVLVFTIVWLWFFRKENRFPQALLLIPCALACVFALNIVRIAALILIGNAGAPEVAFVGFHSQAGWIAFTLVALGFSMATQRLKWIRKPSGQDSPGGDGLLLAGAGTTNIPSLQVQETVSGESPATAAYLAPFLAILGASFVSKSASGHFEWLYPLRFVAALIALWFFRGEYRKLNWRFGWAAPLTGVAICAVWIAPQWWTRGDAAGSLGLALASLSPAARWVWIAFRVAAAVITVPIAEELAFRGYLARRLMARDFTEIPFARLTLLAIGLSSVAFGALHGQHWLVGMVAGLAFAAVLRRRGNMGDAVVAHAVSNLLLAAWVLTRGDWGLW
ncbi:MAG: exosortase E/protease, VPEID-CTERM system [Terracidiphilus sp.]